MPKSIHLPRLLALTVLALAALLVVASPGSAHGKRTTERLVVRGTDTVKDVPCPGGICLELADGAFQGTPVGTGAYTGAMKLDFAGAFPNGEGGLCAPVAGTITLGTGTPDRLVLAVDADSCQDGAGNPATSSFTGVGRWSVESGTGAYAKARGRGLATFIEDAGDREQLTLVGSITR
jgi:hypothetical protein